jgi:hypothetical protein
MGRNVNIRLHHIWSSLTKENPFNSSNIWSWRHLIAQKFSCMKGMNFEMLGFNFFWQSFKYHDKTINLKKNHPMLYVQ